MRYWRHRCVVSLSWRDSSVLSNISFGFVAGSGCLCSGKWTSLAQFLEYRSRSLFHSRLEFYVASKGCELSCTMHTECLDHRLNWICMYCVTSNLLESIAWIFVQGSANVGKSAFISSLLRMCFPILFWNGLPVSTITQCFCMNIGREFKPRVTLGCIVMFCISILYAILSNAWVCS